jgi:hypothetical protein
MLTELNLLNPLRMQNADDISDKDEEETNDLGLDEEESEDEESEEKEPGEDEEDYLE